MKSAPKDRGYVEITKTPDGYKWKNRAGEEWNLFSIDNECNKLRIGENCPYYANGLRLAIFNENGICLTPSGAKDCQGSDVFEYCNNCSK